MLTFKGNTAQGDRGHAAAQGYRGHAEVHGENAIASAFGINGRVMGEIGDLLTLYQWVETKNGWNPVAGITVKVDGLEIKPATWYKLVDGKFVEADE